MMLVSFVILLSAWGVLCEPFECMLRERENCDYNLIPKDFPNTVEELRTICRNIDTYGRCMLEVNEGCGYSEEYLEGLRKGMRFVNSACDEESEIFKVISSNLECISPVARTEEAECDTSKFSKENEEAITSHVERISSNYQRSDILRCFTPIWEITCRSTVVGLHCGPETKQAVEELLTGVNHNLAGCSSEVLEELQPVREAIESIIEAELQLKNAIRKRK